MAFRDHWLFFSNVIITQLQSHSVQDVMNCAFCSGYTNKVMLEHVLALLSSVSCHGINKHCEFSNHLSLFFLLKSGHFLKKFSQIGTVSCNLKMTATSLTSHLNILAYNIPP